MCLFVYKLYMCVWGCVFRLSEVVSCYGCCVMLRMYALNCIVLYVVYLVN